MTLQRISPVFKGLIQHTKKSEPVLGVYKLSQKFLLRGNILLIQVVKDKDDTLSERIHTYILCIMDGFVG